MRRNATKKIIPGAALAGAIALTGMQTVGAVPWGAGIMKDRKQVAAVSATIVMERVLSVYSDPCSNKFFLQRSMQ